jgi:hypothetical protein
MKRYLVMLVLCLVVVPLKAQETALNTVNFNGFRFQYPADLAATLQVSSVPGAVPQSPDGTPSVFDTPPHTEFFLTTTTPYQNQAFVQADRLRVYRTADFANYHPYFMEQVTALQSLLDDRPELATIEPLLPFMAGPHLQILRSSEAYLETETLRGVRYISEFTPGAVFPLASGQFVYTYQALSSDGQYYVTADFHMATPLFPATGEFDYSEEAVAAINDAYYAAAQVTLDAAQPGDFTPNLGVIEEIFESMEIGE